MILQLLFLVKNRRYISQSEIRNSASAESEGGQKFIPPNPLPFCPPERQDSFQPCEARQSVRSFIQKMFEQSCIIPPLSNFPIFARPIRPREAQKGMETLPRRLRRRGSPPARIRKAAEPHESKPQKNPLKTSARTIFCRSKKEKFSYNSLQRAGTCRSLTFMVEYTILG